VSTERRTDEQDQTLRLGDFTDEEISKELAERVLALSPSGKSLVFDVLVREMAYPVVATACGELGLPGVLEKMAIWCHRGGVIHTEEGNHTEAAVDRWQETLLRAFEQALAGPPPRG